MAGRRAIGSPPVTLVQIPQVKDPDVQRALNALKAAVQDLQARQRDIFTATSPGMVGPAGTDITAVLHADGTWSPAGGGGGAVSSVTAGSSMVSVSPTTGAVIVDVVPANFTGIPESGITGLTTDLAAKVPTTRSLAGSGLVKIGGGASADLSADRTISVQLATSRIAGRTTAGTGDLEALTGTQVTAMLDVVGALKGLVPASPSDTTKFLRGDATPTWATVTAVAVADADYGDITVSSGVWTIDPNTVTDAKLRTSAALSVIGRSANSTGNVADISAGSDGDVLRRSGTALGFGSIPESSVTSLVSDLAGKVPTTRTITATAPIRIGGGSSADLSADRTISITTYAGSAAGAVPAGAGSTTKFLREDATWATVGTIAAATVVPDSMVFGSGKDSSLHYDGTATVLGVAPTTGNSTYNWWGNIKFYVLTADVEATDITVDSGVIVITNNFRMFATGTFTNNGVVGNPGHDYSASGAGAGGAIVGQFYPQTSAGATGRVGSNGVGANGGASGSAPQIFPTAATGNATVAGQGGSGGAAGANAGGTGGAMTDVAATGGAFTAMNVYHGGASGRAYATQCTCGSGGGSGGMSGYPGSGSPGSGAGGGGAGYCFTGARHVAGSGRFTCQGGAGGFGSGVAPSVCGGGGGGGGGVFALVYSTATGSWTLDATGGPHGTGFNGGLDGSDGHAGFTWRINLSGDGT